MNLLDAERGPTETLEPPLYPTLRDMILLVLSLSIVLFCNNNQFQKNGVVDGPKVKITKQQGFFADQRLKNLTSDITNNELEI